MGRRRLGGSLPFVLAPRLPPPPAGRENRQPVHSCKSPEHHRLGLCWTSCSVSAATRTTKSSWTDLRPPSLRQLTSRNCRSSTSRHRHQRRRRNGAQPRREDGQGRKWDTTSPRWRLRRRAAATTQPQQSPSRPPNHRVGNPRSGGAATTTANIITVSKAAAATGPRRRTAGGGEVARPSRLTRKKPFGVASGTASA
jgi:hypothetical protein